ncbi:transposase-like protein [Leptotrichia hofstadii F0254]|uniref:Transposase-like protein n=1 Tax=Leptotrichia hofstadii F0254 TaxID=634994 RepID=C9MWV6_9FUSO|nr:transposase-like protein [Leptotrichia hofstadii F0254]
MLAIFSLIAIVSCGEAGKSGDSGSGTSATTPPKYRRKIIYSQYRKSVGEILRILCEYKGVEIIEGHLMKDYVYMLVSISPKISVSSFMGYLKGKSALMMLGMQT